MMLLKKVFFVQFLITVIFFLSCGGDYTESGIEGRWQLKEITGTDGQVKQVDTIFFAFKRKVFEYQKLTTPTTFFHCFGNYHTSDDKLNIEIDENSFDPKDCDSCFDWNSFTRTFTIKKHNSSSLELESEEGVFRFRKY